MWETVWRIVRYQETCHETWMRWNDFSERQDTTQLINHEPCAKKHHTHQPYSGKHNKACLAKSHSTSRPEVLSGLAFHVPSCVCCCFCVDGSSCCFDHSRSISHVAHLFASFALSIMSRISLLFNLHGHGWYRSSFRFFECDGMSPDTQQDKSKTGLRTSVHFVIIMTLGVPIPGFRQQCDTKHGTVFFSGEYEEERVGSSTREQDPLNKGSTQPTEPVVLRVAKTKTCSTDFWRVLGSTVRRALFRPPVDDEAKIRCATRADQLNYKLARTRLAIHDLPSNPRAFLGEQIGRYTPRQ